MMLTDESLIEWASGWVPDEPPGQRARFVEGLREELRQRADALMFVRAQRDVAEEKATPSEKAMADFEALERGEK